MQTTARATSSGGRRLPGSSNVSPVGYPPPLDVSTHITDFLTYFDTQRFSLIPTFGSALIVYFGPWNRDTSVGAWRKR